MRYGPATTLVEQLVQKAGSLTLDDAADLYRAHGAHLLIQGTEKQHLALARARRAAASYGRESEYELARRDAAMAWRRALPTTQGPWLLVNQAIANAAGALVVSDILDQKSLLQLIGPWRQAMGSLSPVGPGVGARERLSMDQPTSGPTSTRRSDW
jgi:hypothetical protein